MEIGQPFPGGDRFTKLWILRFRGLASGAACGPDGPAAILAPEKPNNLPRKGLTNRSLVKFEVRNNGDYPGK